jgi:hypothetical protein
MKKQSYNLMKNMEQGRKNRSQKEGSQKEGQKDGRKEGR